MLKVIKVILFTLLYLSLKFNNLPKFYTTQASSSIITLGENDSRHAIKSLRLRVHDKMDVIDGMGNSFITEIVDDNPKKTTAQAFANWALAVKSYQLNYSDFKTAKSILDEYIQ